jgi:hypothetical protein
MIPVERGSVSPNTRAAVEAAYVAAGIPLDLAAIVKGGLLPADNASGSTHSGKGVVDLRTRTLTTTQALSLVYELRRRNFAAWLRNDQHGGFSPHIHAVHIDAPGQSPAARWQVDEYLAGRDGLTAGGPDYHPRPARNPYPLPEDLLMALTDDDVKRIAAAVWAYKTTDPVNQTEVSTRTLLAQTRVNAKQAAVSGADPNPEARATVDLIAETLGA